MRLTDISIRALAAPESGAVVFPDDTLVGFGVRVSKGGTKCFVLTQGKLRKRETIGRVGVISLSDARAEAKRRLAAYTLGRNTVTSPTWSKAVELFLADAKSRVKERTYDGYAYSFRRHFRFGELKLSEITPADIQSRIDRLRATPYGQHHAYATMRTFMRWSYRRYYVEHNPMDRMVSGFKYRPRTRVLTQDEIRNVWRAAGEDVFGTTVKVLILTGQRVGEITKLAQDMIGDDTVTLPDWLAKNGREHTFPIGSATKRLLARLPLPKSGEYTPTSANWFQRHKLRLDDDSGVSRWRIHDLRRTYASGLASIGVQIPVIERLLNHVSGSFAGIVSVYQRYDFMPEMRDAVERWEAHVLMTTQRTGTRPVHPADGL